MLSCSYFIIICQVLQLVLWLRGRGSETLVFLIWIDGKKRVTAWEENLPYVFIYFLCICITHRFVLFTRAIAGRVVNFRQCIINNRAVPLCCSLELTFLCVLLSMWLTLCWWKLKVFTLSECCAIVYWFHCIYFDTILLQPECSFCIWKHLYFYTAAVNA